MRNTNQTVSRQAASQIALTMTRRNFARLLMAASALAVVEHSTAAQILTGNRKSLTCQSAATASGECVWRNLKIEGGLP